MSEKKEQPGTRERTFAEKLSACLAEIGPIVNDDTNKHFKYGFTSIDAILARTAPVLGKHGLYIGKIRFTKDPGCTYTEYEVAMDLEITDGVGKSAVEGVAGLGLDSQDKAANKAMIAAYKFGLIMALMISRPGASEDADGSQPVDGAAPKPRKPAQPATDPALVEAADLLRAVTTPDEMEAWVGIHYATIKALPEKERKAVWGAVKATAKKAGVAEEGLLAWIAKADAKGGAK